MKNVILVLILSLSFGLSQAFAQGSISGQVADSKTDETLIGATVQIDELGLGTATDADGRFHFPDVAAGTYTLSITFVGYRDHEMEITLAEGEDLDLNIEVEPDFLGLDEVVVVAYGEMDRRDLTGSVASVSGADVETVPVSNIESMLSGRTSGVQVTQSAGLPGGEVTVRIRGNASIGAGNQPLYVVDGIPIYTGDTAGSLAGNADEHTTSALADLNPSDIESIEVLKDASATAIYGSRAANGVVLITTKQGRHQDTEVSVSHYTAWSQPNEVYDVLDAPQYIQIRQEAGTWDPTDDPAAHTTHEWVDAVTRTGMTQNFDMSLRGGDETTRFYIGGTFFDQQSYLITNEFERASGRINVDHDASDWLSIGANLQMTRGTNVRVGSDNLVQGLLTSAALQSPNHPIFLEDGSYNLAAAPGNIAQNVVFVARENDRQLQTLRTIGSIKAEIRPSDNLLISSNWGLDYLSTDDYTRYMAGHGDGGADGAGFNQKRSVYNWISTTTANYRTTIDEVHRLTLLGGMEFQQLRRDHLSVAATDFPSNLFPNVASAANPTLTSSSLEELWGIESYFSRATYNYDERYILEGSARVDGSSRFGDENRFGFFPAGSVAWRLTEEEFMQNVGHFDELRLRLSYGITGNDNIGDFASRPLWESGANYGGQPGLAPDQLESPELRWESAAQVDMGIDMAMFGERVSLSVDLYRQDISDMILNVQLPASSGFTSVTENVGEMYNQGLEIDLSTHNIAGSFNWFTDFNISFNRNEVTQLVDDDPILGIANQRAAVGQPLGSFYLPEWHGVNPDNGEPLWIGEDGNPTSNYGEAEWDYRGSAMPTSYGGLTNTFTYQGWEFSTLLQFVYGNSIYWSSGTFLWDTRTAFNKSTDVLDRWQQPGDVTDMPAAMTQANPNQPSTRFLKDGSYLRVRDVTLSYDLPTDLLTQFGLRHLQIYVQGTNLMTFTEYPGLDPEVGNQGTATLGQGTDFFTPPQMRTIQVGFNMSF